MTRHTPMAIAFAALAAAPLASAEENQGPWEISAELGAIATSGNTETTTVQGKIDAVQDLEQWRNNYILSVLFKEDEVTQPDGTERTEKTAEKFAASAKSAYKLAEEHSNLFVYASHTDDEFAAYSTYTTLAVGYGRRLYDAETMQLDVELGPGYFWAEQEFEDGTSESEDGAVLRGAANFDWQVSENADFKQVLSVEAAQDNTRTQSDTSLSTSINDSMQMKVGFSLTSDTDVAPGKESTDTTTYINLVYKF